MIPRLGTYEKMKGRNKRKQFRVALQQKFCRCLCHMHTCLYRFCPKWDAAIRGFWVSDFSTHRCYMLQISTELYAGTWPNMAEQLRVVGKHGSKMLRIALVSLEHRQNSGVNCACLVQTECRRPPDNSAVPPKHVCRCKLRVWTRCCFCQH